MTAFVGAEVDPTSRDKILSICTVLERRRNLGENLWGIFVEYLRCRHGDFQDPGKSVLLRGFPVKNRSHEPDSRSMIEQTSNVPATVVEERHRLGRHTCDFTLGSVRSNSEPFAAQYPHIVCRRGWSTFHPRCIGDLSLPQHPQQPQHTYLGPCEDIDV